MGMVALVALLTGSLNVGLAATGTAMTDDIPPVASQFNYTCRSPRYSR
jgi:hypothetical protein